MEEKKIQVEGELDNMGVGLSRGLECMNTLVHKQGKARTHVVGLALVPYNIMTAIWNELTCVFTSNRQNNSLTFLESVLNSSPGFLTKSILPTDWLKCVL